MDAQERADAIVSRLAPKTLGMSWVAGASATIDDKGTITGTIGNSEFVIPAELVPLIDLLSKKIAALEAQVRASGTS